MVMARHCLLSTCCALLAGSLAAAPGKDSQRLFVSEERTLANGVRVRYCQRDSPQRAEVRIAVGVGGAHESVRQAGTSHLLEHALLYPQHRRKARDVEAVRAAGGSMHAWTGWTVTIFCGSVPSEGLELLLTTMASLLRKPNFGPSELPAVKARVIAEMAECHSHPPQHPLQHLGFGVEVLATLHEKLFGLPRRRIIGSEQTVRDTTHGELLAWHKDHYVAGNMLVVVVSRHQTEEALDLVSRSFQAMPGGQSKSAQLVSPGRPAHTGELRLVVRDLAVHGRVQLAHGYGFREEHTEYAKTLRWLVEDLSERAFAYRLGLLHHPRRIVHTCVRGQAVLLYVRLRSSGRGWRWLHDTVEDEFGRLRAGRISPEELSAAKTRVLGQLRIRFSKNRAIADFAATAPPELLHGTLLRTLEAVRIEDVRGFCARSLVEQNRFFVLEKPILTVAGALRWLAGLGAVIVTLGLAVLVRSIIRRRATRNVS